MNKILLKEQLSDDVFMMKLEAPLIAEERLPGQFIILQLDSEYGERIPLTIADADEKEGSITIIFQVVGKTTSDLSDLKQGEYVDNLVGPLGQPTHIENFGTVVCVGGGIGVAPCILLPKRLKKRAIRLSLSWGPGTKISLLWKKR